MNEVDLRYLFEKFKQTPKELMCIIYEYYIDVLYCKGIHKANLSWTDIDYIVAKYPSIKFKLWLSDKKLILTYFELQGFVKIDIYSKFDNIIGTITFHKLKVHTGHLPKFFSYHPIFETNGFIEFTKSKLLKTKLEYLTYEREI